MTGIDVELASSVSPAAAARRDNLDLFVKAVAEFQAVDGQVTLAALLAWLRGRGRVRPGPRRGHPVRGRLGQAAHRPPRQGPRVGRGVPGRRAPSASSRPTAAASSWLTRAVRAAGAAARRRPRPAAAAPATRPTTSPRWPRRAKAHEARRGAPARVRRVDPRPAPARRVRRGAGPAPARRRSAPRRTSLATREAMAGWGGEPDAWLDMPPKGAVNPYAAALARPALADLAPHRRGRAPARRRRAGARAAEPGDEPDELEDMLAARARSQQWDDELERLLAEARRDRSPDDRGAAAGQPVGHRAGPAARRPGGVRPRPGPADAAAAVAGGAVRHPLPRLGRGAVRPAALLDPDELPGRGDAGIDDDADLRELIEALRGRPVRRPGRRTPSSRRSRWCSAGQVVRGRIDAVYAEPTTARTWSSTGRPTAPRPPTRSSSRSTALAWAELTGVPARRVRRGVLLRPHRADLVEPPTGRCPSRCPER